MTTRLAGIDANFLYSETPTTLMHTLKIAVLDVPPAPGESLFSRFRRELEARLHCLPLFRQRIVNIPLGLHFPVWADDPGFDLSRHIFHRPLPAPAGPAEMDAVIADIASRPLRRDRPLWEIWMLDRLADGGVVFVAKIHHALADGIACSEMLRQVMSPERAASDVAGGPNWYPEPTPGLRGLLAGALRDTPRRLRRFLPLLGETLRGRVAAVRASRRTAVRPPSAFQSPKTVFNRALPHGRVFATTRIDLERVRAVKRALGVTVNDVVLALAAGATASYLEEAGTLPRKPLSASVPIGIQLPGFGRRADGNHLSTVITSLCTDVRDPVARVEAISEVMRSALEVHENVGNESMRAWAEFTPIRAFGVALRLYSRLRLADHHRPPVNLIVSNVRGPERPLWIAGARLRQLYSVGPILDAIGLNFTVWSYAGELSFAVLSHAGVGGAARVLADRLHESLDELERAIGARLEAAQNDGGAENEAYSAR